MSKTVLIVPYPVAISPLKYNRQIDGDHVQNAKVAHPDTQTPKLRSHKDAIIKSETLAYEIRRSAQSWTVWVNLRSHGKF